jgi:endogenous inhibitor of DNA gyrase (YacG/DUF329 family)
MVELELVLDFACSGCGKPVSVTVKCAANDVAMAGRNVATVNVPCPTCGSISKLYFQPDGTLRAVAPYVMPRLMPEPSIN